MDWDVVLRGHVGLTQARERGVSYVDSEVPVWWGLGFGCKVGGVQLGWNVRLISRLENPRAEFHPKGQE